MSRGVVGGAVRCLVESVAHSSLPSSCGTKESDSPAPSGHRFDTHRPLHKRAKFTLIRQPLLTDYSFICAFRAAVLRPFCAQVDGSRFFGDYSGTERRYFEIA
jgi:hypothetical protein